MRILIASLLAAFALSSAFAQDQPPPAEDSDTIVVPGKIERPVPTPPGDPRTNTQRMRDIRAWDRCVTRAQSVGDTDPMKYQPDTPEEYCRERLGMAERTAVPISRQ